MNKLSLLLSLLFIVPGVFATTYTANEEFSLDRECFFEGDVCGATFDCTLSVYDPDGTLVVNNGDMTHQDSYYNYSMEALSENGQYRTRMTCTDGTNSGSEIFYFSISQTGGDENSLNIFLVIGILSILLLILGVILTNYPVLASAGAMFIVTGMYVMIYGLQFVNNMYTQAIAFTFIGLGLFFLITSGLKLVSLKDDTF